MWGPRSEYKTGYGCTIYNPSPMTRREAKPEDSSEFMGHLSWQREIKTKIPCLKVEGVAFWPPHHEHTHIHIPVTHITTHTYMPHTYPHLHRFHTLIHICIDTTHKTTFTYTSSWTYKYIWHTLQKIKSIVKEYQVLYRRKQKGCITTVNYYVCFHLNFKFPSKVGFVLFYLK